MTPAFDCNAYLDAVSQAHGLNLTGERRAEVLVQLQRIHGMAQSVLEFPMDDHVEPAPTFLPTSIIPSSSRIG